MIDWVSWQLFTQWHLLLIVTVVFRFMYPPKNLRHYDMHLIGQVVAWLIFCYLRYGGGVG